MWFTHDGVFGLGAAAVSSPRSKNARYDPSVIRKKMWTYGQYSPVEGTWSARMRCASGSPRMSS